MSATRIKLIIVSIFCVMLFFGFGEKALAATVNYYVDPLGTNDSSHGTGTGANAWLTLQYAVTSVANPTVDTIIINVAAGTYTNGNNDIDIDRNFIDLRIIGAGADSTIFQPNASTSAATDRNFEIGFSENVTMEAMTIRYGRTSSYSGAIYCNGDNLTLRDVVVFDNDSSGGTGYSGAMYARGNLTIEDSTFYNNDCTYTGAIMAGSSGKNVIFTNVTFYNNSGSSGSVYINSGTSYWTNVIVTGGRGILLQGGVHNFKNSAFVGNTSGYDIDYYNVGTVVNNGYNLVGYEEGGTYFTNGVNNTIVVGDVSLSSLNYKNGLSDNGASNGTLSVGLLAGNNVVNTGTTIANGIVSIPSVDQTGRSRVGETDIGPLEYQGGDTADPLIVSSSLSSDNTYVDITLDEGVYGNSDGTGGVEASDFSVVFSQGVGGATGATISSVKGLDNSDPVGGETVLRLYLSISGTSNGVETIKIKPASNSSIYDSSGNSMNTIQETGIMTLSGAFHYYVRADGNNANTGLSDDAAHAWLTIQYAVTTVANPTTAPIIIHISGDTYTLNNDDIYIDRNFINLTLRGAGAETTIIQPHANPASATTRNFEVGYSEYVTFEDMTIRYGNGSYSGGIYSNSAGLTLRRCYIFDNNSGGSSYGGGLWNSRGAVVIEDTTLDSNTGTYISGAYISGDSLKIYNSTFVNNTGDSYGSAYFHGFTQPAYIYNSIFTKGNNVEFQGSFNTYVNNSIFIDNGGADIDYYYYYGDLIASNTIVGQEYNSYSSPGVPHIANGTNGNIVYTTTTTLESLNISNTLAINGSANGVKTLAVSAGSPVINAGASATNGSYSTPELDQRGASRAGTTDIGPYEYDGVIGAPYLSSKYPADDATGVAVNSNLALYFNKTVNAQGGADNDITIKKASDNSTFETIDVESAQISGSGSATITINPSSNFEENTAYYVFVGTDAFDDTISNSYAGISATTTWTFTTADATAPTITSISSSKTNGSYRAGEVIDIDVIFSEAVTSTGNVTVTLETGDTDRTCTFTISNSTTGTCNYTVQSGDNTSDLSATISGTIKDQSNNSLTNYTPSTSLSLNKNLIIDTSNPTVLYFSPADGASNFGVTTSLEIAFNETIATSTGYIVIYKTSDDSIVETFDLPTAGVAASSTNALIINPTNSLSGETGYYVLMDATVVDDIAGNSFAGISATSTWNFTTADADAPTATFSPIDNSTALEIDTNFVITFSENVDAESGNINLYKTNSNQLVEAFDVSTDIITTSSTTITINPNTDLEYETDYYILIDATAFDDTSGNSYAGIANTATWNFQTKDTPICQTIANAATYNAYPTCGVATCNTGFALSGGACVSSGAATPPTPPPAVGHGVHDVAIPMHQTGAVGQVDNQGVNILMYSQATANFSAIVSSNNHTQNHSVKIISVDLLNNIITLLIQSEPQTISLKLDDKKKVDLDKDSIPDVEISFTDLVVNRIELTVDSLYQENDEKSEDEKSEEIVVVNNSFKQFYDFKRLLKLNDQGEDVLYLQKGLNKCGYALSNRGIGSAGQESTYFGKLTQTALSKFQKAQKLNSNSGVFDSLSKERLLEILAKDEKAIDFIGGEPKDLGKIFQFSRDLKLGMKGEDVKELQKFLNNNGFIVSGNGYGSKGKETNYFGQATKAALIKYQIANGINPSLGFLGAETRKRIN